MGEKVSLRRRVFNASIALVLNLIVWVIIPSLISSSLAGAGSSIPLGNLQFVYAFGAVITGLQVLGALTEGMAVSVPLISGAFVAAAFYVWEAVDGGRLSFDASGLPVTLTFQTLLFLLILPPLFNAVRVPLEFLLERSEAAMPAKELP